MTDAEKTPPPADEAAEADPKAQSAAAAGDEAGQEAGEKPQGNSTKRADRDPAVQECEALIEAGNYKLAAEKAQALLDTAPNETVRDAAAEILERLSPDRLAVWIGVACLVVIGLLALFTLGR
jgi:uncharacterized membrane protein